MTIRQTTLANGIRVISDSIPHVETISLGVWVRAGSRNETENINGAAHFLEHMAFKGTTNRSAKDIAETIENVGGYLNAYTSREITAYYARVLKQDLALGLDILADILQNSVFDPAEMNREREVILQEIGQTNDTPSDIVFDYFENQCFPDQPIGRSILGPAETVRNMTREDLIGFMEKHYRPDQMVVSAAGNLEHDHLVEVAEKLFSGIKARPAPQEELVPALYQGGCFHKVKELDQLHVLLGFKGCSLTEKDYFPLSLLSTLLGGGMSSRLFQEVREKRGLVYSVYAFSSSYSDNGVFGIYAGTGKAESKTLIETIFNTLKDACKKIHPEEIDRAKNQLKASLLMSYESTSSRSRKLANNLLLLGRPYTQTELIEKINAVTFESAMEAFQGILASNLTVTTIGPSQELPCFDTMCDLKNQVWRAAS